MTQLVFGRGSRLWCRKCLGETLHCVGGACCHCSTLHVPESSTLQPQFNHLVSAKAHQLRPAKNPRRAGKSGGRTRAPKPDRIKLRQALDTAGSMAAAARSFGVSEKTIHRWLLSYGITARDWRKPKSKDVPRGTISHPQQIGVTT